MTPDTILDQVRNILSRRLRVETPINMSTDLLHDLQLDSIQVLELVVEIENHFKVCLEPGDEQGIVTVGDVVTLLHARLEPTA